MSETLKLYDGAKIDTDVECVVTVHKHEWHGSTFYKHNFTGWSWLEDGTPVTNAPGIIAISQPAASETSETNRSKLHDPDWVRRMAETEDGKCITAGGMLTRNQPAACGPGLTSSERWVLEMEVKELYKRADEATEAEYDEQAHVWSTMAATINNLLTRDAKADTVTAERLRKAEALLESCWMVMDAFGGAGGSGKGNMRATMAAVDAFLGDPKQAIAEAEAALAKGGA